jgi:Yippee zinc-binding/DNA-binding /Mis18, centromere assembly
MNTMTLTAASNIQRSADVYTSKAGPDVGSTYFRFTCAECQNGLGRYYLTTSADLDSLREKFTFTVESITSYELGKSQHGKIQDLVLDEPSISTVEVRDIVNNGEESGTELTLKSLNEEMLKVPHLLTFLRNIFLSCYLKYHLAVSFF